MSQEGMSNVAFTHIGVSQKRVRCCKNDPAVTEITIFYLFRYNLLESSQTVL